MGQVWGHYAQQLVSSRAPLALLSASPGGFRIGLGSKRGARLILRRSLVASSPPGAAERSGAPPPGPEAGPR